MTKSELIKARCTVEQKQYIEKFMYKISIEVYQKQLELL